MSVDVARTGARWRALPLQVLETRGGTVLKRGCTELRVTGDGAADAVRMLLDATSGTGATREEIRERFAGPQRSQVDELFGHLAARRLLVPAEGPAAGAGDEPESSNDVFYWSFGYRPAEARARLDRHVVILGVNHISRQLAAALAALQAPGVQVVDHPRLRNLRLFDAAGRPRPGQWPASIPEPVDLAAWLAQRERQAPSCLVATSDFGGQQALLEWNELCCLRGWPFLPVVLQNLVGYVGPLVFPGETACLACLRSRQDACSEDFATRREVEAQAFEGQAVSGFLPSMASILGDVAATELAKLFLDLPHGQAGRLIEVSLAASTMRSRRVLKIPRCAVCSPLNQGSQVKMSKAAVLPAGALR